MKVLVVNCGSSSLKYQLIDMENEGVLASGKYERIGEKEAFITHKVNGQKIEITGNNPVWLPELHCYRRVDELIEGDILLFSDN